MKKKTGSRNAFYWAAVTATLAVITAAAAIYSCKTQKITLTYALTAPLIADLYLLFILGAVSLIMRTLIPERRWNFERGLFKVRERELKLYNKLKVRRWKDRIPEMGKMGGFAKREIKSTERKYIEKFLRETCYAEAMHFNVGLLGFTALFFFRAETLFIALPLVLVNFALHALPCIVQRFTRYRLYRVYMCINRTCAEAGEGYV